MHLWAVHEVLQPSQAHVEIRVDEHSPDRADGRLDYGNARRSAENDHWEKLDGLVDEDLDGMGTDAGEPVDLRRRVVCFVKPPEERGGVLPAVEEVDVEVVSDDEDGDLRRDRPRGDEAAPPRSGRGADGVEEPADQHAEQPALEEAVSHEVGPETLPEQPLPLVVGEELLEAGESCRSGQRGTEAEQLREARDRVQLQSASASDAGSEGMKRSFFRAAISLG